MSNENLTSKCRLCQETGLNSTFIAREMMFGLRDEFCYFECHSCGSLQLLTIPDNIGTYYPNTYYSLQPQGTLKALLLAQWGRHSFGERTLIGRILSAWYGNHQAVEAVARLRTSKDARILDIGCGSGDFLRLLRSLGFSQLTGIDPFLSSDLLESDSLQILRRDVSDLRGAFDLIMFNHSLEHVPDPLDSMSRAAELLAPGGFLVIRIPVAGGFAPKHYGGNWVALDPPRHILVPTHRALIAAAAKLGLRCRETVYESDEFMFWGSEQYKADIPLNDPRSYAQSKLWRLLPPRAIREFRLRARELNALGESDAAAFAFTK